MSHHIRVYIIISYNMSSHQGIHYYIRINVSLYKIMYRIVSGFCVITSAYICLISTYYKIFKTVVYTLYISMLIILDVITIFKVDDCVQDFVLL